jgi:uncharacterized protein
MENVLLEGIVGSTAYGLNHAGSDVDRLGVYAAPATAFHGLDLPIDKAASVVEHEPDRTLHEVRKFCLLALSCNPTASELLWLPRDLYEIRTPLGAELIEIRGAFLSAQRVREAYLGYATQQLTRLASKEIRSQSDAKIAKHARHLARLAHQGRELYETGFLRVRLENPQWYVDFGLRVAADVSAARDLLAASETAFDEAISPLPAQPDRAAVESWLQRVRACIH